MHHSPVVIHLHNGATEHQESHLCPPVHLQIAAPLCGLRPEQILRAGWHPAWGLPKQPRVAPDWCSVLCQSERGIVGKDQTGQVIDERFRIEAKMRDGKFGDFWRATHINMHTPAPGEAAGELPAGAAGVQCVQQPSPAWLLIGETFLSSSASCVANLASFARHPWLQFWFGLCLRALMRTPTRLL